MTVYRTDFSYINEAWYEYVQSGISDAEIPEMCVYYTADHADKHADIQAHPDFIRYGQQMYVDGSPTGLYAGKSKLRKFAQDANVATWEHRFKVATTQPEKIGRDPNPLARGVEFIERVSGFRKITSLIDWNNNPVVNRAGDRISGFEVELPAPVYRYGSNFATIPSWALNLDGTVNNSHKVLPIRYRAHDGTLTTIQNITIPAGRGKLRITQLPLRPTEENNVQFFPINWEWQVSPVGWSEPILNEGFQELVYLDENGDVATNAQVVAGTYTKKVKRIILNDDNEPVREKQLLDWYSRKLKISTLSNESQGTITVGRNSTQMNGVTATFTEEWVGMYVKMLPAGADPTTAFFTTITAADGPGNVATFTDHAPYDWTNAVNFAAVPYADLSVIPV